MEAGPEWHRSIDNNRFSEICCIDNTINFILCQDALRSFYRETSVQKIDSV